MPIASAPINVDLRITKVFADDRTKKHLENLGLTINSHLSVLLKNGESIVCLLKNGRLALDGNVASKIFVANY